ncbi:excinuclease [Francisella philomiragia]|uniref:excinuclease n=1 Tax=Francisella philomiragia TaxID=28110 RepID=UPI0035117AD4
MKKILMLSAVVISSIYLAGCSSGANGVFDMSIPNAQESMPSNVKDQVGDFKFYFGKDSAPLMSKDLGSVQTSVRTNGVFKDSNKSCNWVFYSALLKLKEQAQARGATGVANIQSNWKNNTTSSDKTFVCGKGNMMSGVALIGTAIK